MLCKLLVSANSGKAVQGVFRRAYHPEPFSLDPPKPSLGVKISRIIVALSGPLIIILGYQTYKVEEERKNHPRPPYIDYDHLYAHRKIKPLPYGDGLRTPFHNPYYNALPGIGYEAEDPYVTKMKAEGKDPEKAEH